MLEDHVDDKRVQGEKESLLVWSGVLVGSKKLPQGWSGVPPHTPYSPMSMFAKRYSLHSWGREARSRWSRPRLRMVEKGRGSTGLRRSFHPISARVRSALALGGEGEAGLIYSV